MMRPRVNTPATWYVLAAIVALLICSQYTETTNVQPMHNTTQGENR